MAKTIFTQEEINRFTKDPRDYKDPKDLRHSFYGRCTDICDSMKVHADGLYPEKLLCERRPNEPLIVKEYREKIWKAKTKPTFSKVFSSLQKIRRSQDWSIRFPGQEEFSKIADEETLEKYTAETYPFFVSLTNWIFTIALRKYLIDPNAVVIIKPLSWEVLPTEYLQPFATIYDSCHVIEFVQEDYAVVEIPEGCTFYVRNKPQQGRSILIVTTLEFLRYDQINTKGDFALVEQMPHEITILPAVQLKGVLIDQIATKFLYESRVAGMIPELDEAVREYSDLQAAKVNHMYPERWEFSQNECGTCKGSKIRPNPMWTGIGCGSPETIDCETCGGQGYIVAGPYSKIMIRPANAAIEGGISNLPIPPAGFVEKDVEIIKVMEESVRMHLYNSLAAINFEFLAEVPLAQSGVAKAEDRDEANNTAHSIAEDIVALMDSLYKIIAYYRYKTLYSFDDIDEMVPVVNVPEKYDLLSSAAIAQELKDNKDNINPVMRNAIEIDYAGKRFYTEPEVKDRVVLILELDPLAGVSEDDKMSRLSNKGISQESYVISSNIVEFVQRAIDEDPGFVDKELKEQKEVMKRYAQEQIAAESIATEAIGDSETNVEDEDIIGKIPLAVQQLSLAATRAIEAGDTELAKTIKAKINQLLGKVVNTVAEVDDKSITEESFNV